MLLISIEVLLLVFADRITKILAETFLVAGNMIPVIPGVVGLELLEGGNTGAAFGILRENRLALIILPLIVSCALLYMLFFMKIRSKLLKYSVIMILAGGLGNLYDRIFGGVVVDFIKFIFFEFPTFNFADCCISIGAALLFVAIIFSKSSEPIFEHTPRFLMSKKERDAADKTLSDSNE